MPTDLTQATAAWESAFDHRERMLAVYRQVRADACIGPYFEWRTRYRDASVALAIATDAEIRLRNQKHDIEIQLMAEEEATRLLLVNQPYYDSVLASDIKALKQAVFDNPEVK